MMNLRKISEHEYEELYSHMKRDFPGDHELAPFSSIKRNLDNKIYDGIFLTENAADIGYALITAPDDLKFALINYFAVYPQYRSKGYGSEFLKNIISRYPERVLVIEATDPSAAKNSALHDEAVRRVQFYERAGFGVLPTERAKIFGLDMLIMASSSDGKLNTREIMHSLYMPSFGGSPERLKNIDVINA